MSMDLSPNEINLLKVLNKSSQSLVEASIETGLGKKETMSAASWLKSKGLIDITEESIIFYFANEEGKRYAEEGLPERRAAEWLNQMGESILDDLPLDNTELKVVVGWLKKKNLVDLEKTDDGLKLKPTGNLDETPDEPLLVLLSQSKIPEDEIEVDLLSILKGRQLLSYKAFLSTTLPASAYSSS